MDRKTLVAFALLVLLFIAGDTWSTYWAISHGACEANPLMARLVGHPVEFVAVKVALIFSVVIAIFSMHLERTAGQYLLRFFYSVAFLIALVVVWNLTLFRVG
jgi:hypothetical protein